MTLTETIETAMKAKGWSDEEIDGWKYDSFSKYSDCRFKPSKYVADRARWQAMIVMLPDVLPVGSTLTDPDGGVATVKDSGYVQAQSGDAVSLVEIFLNIGGEGRMSDFLTLQA